jgi:putative endonuclease
MRGGWVYIMTNRPNGTLYTGVTADLSRRAYEHREGLCEGFTKRYRLARLVWYEFHGRRDPCPFWMNLAELPPYRFGD